MAQKKPEIIQILGDGEEMQNNKVDHPTPKIINKRIRKETHKLVNTNSNMNSSNEEQNLSKYQKRRVRLQRLKADPANEIVFNNNRTVEPQYAYFDPVSNNSNEIGRRPFIQDSNNSIKQRLDYLIWSNSQRIENNNLQGNANAFIQNTLPIISRLNQIPSRYETNLNLPYQNSIAYQEPLMQIQHQENNPLLRSGLNHANLGGNLNISTIYRAMHMTNEERLQQMQIRITNKMKCVEGRKTISINEEVHKEMQSSVLDELKCAICWSILKYPVQMPCLQHSVCYQCTLHLIEYQSKFICPMCKNSGQEQKANPANLQNLPINLELEKIVNAYEIIVQNLYKMNQELIQKNKELSQNQIKEDEQVHVIYVAEKNQQQHDDNQTQQNMVQDIGKFLQCNDNDDIDNEIMLIDDSTSESIHK